MSAKDVLAISKIDTANGMYLHVESNGLVAKPLGIWNRFLKALGCGPASMSNIVRYIKENGASFMKAKGSQKKPLFDKVKNHVPRDKEAARATRLALTVLAPKRSVSKPLSIALKSFQADVSAFNILRKMYAKAKGSHPFPLRKETAVQIGKMPTSELLEMPAGPFMRIVDLISKEQAKALLADDRCSSPRKKALKKFNPNLK